MLRLPVDRVPKNEPPLSPAPGSFSHNGRAGKFCFHTTAALKARKERRGKGSGSVPERKRNRSKVGRVKSRIVVSWKWEVGRLGGVQTERQAAWRGEPRTSRSAPRTSRSAHLALHAPRPPPRTQPRAHARTCVAALRTTRRRSASIVFYYGRCLTFAHEDAVSVADGAGFTTGINKVS